MAGGGGQSDGMQCTRRKTPAAAFGLLLLLLLAAAAVQASQAGAAPRPPNVILIFADDLGYADIGLFGARGYRTPHLDRLGREGCRLTDFYAAQPVCSASRAALLTGCYPNRVGIRGALGPTSRVGIDSGELLMPELFKQKGYATAIVGKWHLGHQPRFLPLQHGFDEFYGLPYSNDMWPRHPTSRDYPPLLLIEGSKTIAVDPDQTRLTTSYTRRATDFIRRNRKRPFFLYLPHSMPHVPLHVSAERAGATGAGLFADVIAEIDWSVGEIRRTLDELGLSRNTLIVFTSDNGPWLSYGNHAGSAFPLREGKGTTWEGGVREPFIAWWPGKIPAGTVRTTPAMTIDLLPTFAHLLNRPLPKDRILDGRNIWPVLQGKAPGELKDRPLYFYWDLGLEAVRSGRWKLHLPHAYRSLEGEPGRDGRPAPYVQKRTSLALYDLASDPREVDEISARHPDVMEKMLSLAQKAREDLGDSLTGVKGKNLRPPGML